MSQEQITAFYSTLSAYKGVELEELKRIIDRKIIDDYERKENFMLHNQIDDYIYIVYFADGSQHYFCKGRDAYERYMKDSTAIRVARKTKDLYPVYEDLMVKENKA